MSVGDNYKRIAEDVSEAAVKCGRNLNDITILPVSKTQSLQKMIDLGDSGIIFFGESKVQEALPKIEAVKKIWDKAEFHFIGKFQTNKASKIIENFELIHSIDRLEAVKSASKAAEKKGSASSVLIQISLAGEEQKNGASPENLDEVLEYASKNAYINLKGLMMMPPWEENPEVNRKYFKMSRDLFDKYKKTYPSMSVLSMGMSGDYKIAVEEGSTLLRIGTSIFGGR